MEDELSLRELIDALFKAKGLLISVIIGVILLSVAVSFVLERKYEVETTIMINPIHEGNEVNSFDAYVNEMISPTIYAQHLKSSQLLSQVLNSLELENGSSEISKLRSDLNIEVIPETNLVSIKLKGQNPKQITQILNTLVKHSTIYTSELISREIGALIDKYQSQMQAEQEKLNEAILEYNELKAGTGLPSLILLQESVIEGSSQFILQANDEMLNELHNLDKAKQIELKQINEKIDKLTEIYNNYNTKYEEARSVSSFGLANNRINQIVEADTPLEPVGLGKLLYIAIGAIVGVMVGVSVVFFQVYWRKSSIK